ncbi:alpha/beta fold hydrolase [Kibdelosporangium persicum]|uniref:Pimeloyl-ACP methyl ester carboxylesterase n=1 Tax=Kibdelosporangium persicum TaxID=2698649 RepID=A0ABX2FDE7_9PSEU|nr:alpha/beta hydrolase [Kibdelosporangium persicum]NRN68790.1 Pimeloyl-ACP methyl ester carboxylesterase [Kibdelosporangium persicum]
MNVRSHDGTQIAYELLGTGQPLLLVAGALQGRAGHRPWAEELARHFTVISYDRRGRGDSEDTPPYAVDREVEDLAALIAACGGTASVYGHSSGAALVMHAAARGLPIDKIVLHEPPFGDGSDEERQREDKEAAHIADLLAQGRNADAVKTFYAPIGMPPEILDHMANDPAIQANAPTILYDPYAVMSPRSRNGMTPVEQARGITTQALVLAGDASPPWMIDASRQIGEALPNGRFRLLEGQQHVVPPDVLTPVLTGFLLGR